MNRLAILLTMGSSLCGAGAQALSQATPGNADIERWASYYANQYGVPYAFVDAIIDVESAWQPYAVSNKGAAGLMQLMPETAYRFGVRNRFRIEENLQGGVAYLAALMGQFGRDLRLVAAAYYTGGKRIAKLGLDCADKDVYRYVSAVERKYKQRLKGAGNQ
jgi:soluble lytic murein transglycosylase-like protein